MIESLKSPLKEHSKPTEEGFHTYCERKILSPEVLPLRLPELREGKTLATLNGSFDLLHAGHMHILYEASLQADLLLVALNTDESIQEYKSPLRPIVPLHHRVSMLCALGFVDYVTWFRETTPLHLLETIVPDVHVNGSEYGEECIEKEVVERNGGKIHIVKLVPGLSTSDLITRILQKCG